MDAEFEDIWEYHRLIAQYNKQKPAMETKLQALLKSLYPGAPVDGLRTNSYEVGKFIDRMWTGLISMNFDDSCSVADSAVAGMD